MYALILAAALGSAPDYTLCACDYQIAPAKKVVAVVKATKSVVVKKETTGTCANGQCGTLQRPVRIFRRWR